MPTYTVTTPEGCLTADKRAAIAREITRVHSETTGAPTYFAQVIFNEVAPGKYFVGGQPLHGQQLFVNGQIRAGRTRGSKDAVVERI
jgi:phenylpyruvate tautomerase PptA (4-oxalocrotonate tautomerase family)